MLESSSVSYELRIALDQSNEQLSLLFEPGGALNYSDRILRNIRNDFVSTSAQFTLLTERLQSLLDDQFKTLGSLVPADKYQKISAEIYNIDDIWSEYQQRIKEIESYNINTLRAGNKLWEPLDASVAHNSSLATSITALNHLVYQSSIEQNQRLAVLYVVMLILAIGIVWAIWFSTLKPLAKRLESSYQEIVCKNTRLDYQANHDALTGLYNRAAFNSRITHLEATKNTNLPYCLVLIDLDNFKITNDSMGHNIGDSILQKVAADMLENPLAGECAYRIGGDEYALLIDRLDDEIDLKSRLVQLLEVIREPIEIEQVQLHTSCSIGAAIAGISCGYDQKEMFAAADKALYSVKKSGRNGFQLCSKAQQQNQSEKDRQDDDLSKSVDLKKFNVFYQPIIDITTQNIVAYEARVHWQHPTLGQLQQENWIDDASRLSLDTKITKQVIQTIEKHFKYWLKQDMKILPMTVDIGQSILLSGEAYTLVTNLSENLPVSSYIGIEVSELMFNERSFDAVTEQLARFIQAGIPVTIDHYGRGHSSLLQLRKIPFDTLKVDKKLTLQADKDKSLQTYISSLVAFTEGVGKTLICQDVQSAKGRQTLIELGCRYMQSRHISTVLTYDAISESMDDSMKSETA
ncbi:EAL domain-containing protein [Leucothrix arctica]|uniref:GGDEF-domain containing protein n=1 Tax=Leucothrix arctica TaxID=1481894 RepID=A0A317C8B2_9GAMM|nr:EAL domain-containing protein [Leucothrix arctica]PWQ93613.1 hypothetical protein DKT75_18520 [Leucothrix arctica]